MGRPAIPEFFIIGAPKCGTTALHHYLSRHPAVFMPTYKEPNFFCSDLNNAWVRNLPEYEALFGPAPPGTIRGEASTMYLFSEVAVERIRDCRPDAKLI